MFKLVVIATTTLLGWFLLQKTSNYISFSFQETPIQLPMRLTIISFIILLLCQIWLIKIALKNWLNHTNLHKTINIAKKALFSLLAGDQKNAINFALKIINQNQCGWLGLLIATKAAQEQNLCQLSQQYLTKLEILIKKNSIGFLGFNFKNVNEEITIGIIRSEIYYSEREFIQCLKELNSLHKKFPKNKQILTKLALLHQKLNNQEELIKLMPKLKKMQISVDLNLPLN